MELSAQLHCGLSGLLLKKQSLFVLSFVLVLQLSKGFCDPFCVWVVSHHSGPSSLVDGAFSRMQQQLRICKIVKIQICISNRVLWS